jgi:hypothetical protein
MFAKWMGQSASNRLDDDGSYLPGQYAVKQGQKELFQSTCPK